MPTITSDVALSGFNGFTVVAALLKDKIPETAIIIPIIAIVGAIKSLSEFSFVVGKSSDNNHINTAEISRTNGGGTLSFSML